MDNQFLKMNVDGLEKNISDLQRDNESLKQAVLNVSASVEGLSRKISMLEKGLATKTDITHVKQLIKQTEVVKKINKSEPIRTDCKVSVNLDGKVIAESIVERTTDGFKMSANDIKGVY